MFHLLNTQDASVGCKTVIVFGCGRGGTSAVAGMLRELGVVFPNATHPLKHESSPVVYKDDQVDIASTRSNISAMEHGEVTWGWKSPRDLYSVQRWVSLVTNPCFLIVFRNPADTIASVARYEKIPFALAAKHVGEVQAELGRFIAFMPFPIAVVSYEALCGEARQMVKGIAAWLHVAATEAQTSAAADFVCAPQRGYRRMCSEAAEACDTISPTEIAADQIYSQVVLIGGINQELQTRINALAADVEQAKAIVEALQKQIAWQEELLLIPAHTTRADELIVKAPLAKIITPIATEPPPIFTELQRITVRNAYDRLWHELSLVLQERIHLQRQMDDLAQCRDRNSDCILAN